jgi:hypothetical protein
VTDSRTTLGAIKLPPGLAKCLALAEIELDAGRSRILEAAFRTYLDRKISDGAFSERAEALVKRYQEADSLLVSEGGPE